MSKFEKVKNAFSKSTRFFITIRKDLIVLLMLLIVWTVLFCFVKIPADPSGMKNKIKIICNDDKINQPITSKVPITESMLLVSGLVKSFFFILLTFVLRKRGSDLSVIRFLFELLLLILLLFTGAVLVWLWVNSVPSETLAPNFLAACRPHELDLLCSPDSHLDRDRVVLVTCTTPAKMWIPALSNTLPTLAAVQAYLMFAGVLQMIYYWKWEGMLTVISLCELAITILHTVGIGYFTISDNLANFDKEFVSGYLKCCAIACVWLAVDSFRHTSKSDAPKLPRYWNDVVVNNEVTPQTGQIPTNLTSSLHEPPATTGTTTGETENAYQTIYPNLPEYENPPSYGTSVIRY